MKNGKIIRNFFILTFLVFATNNLFAGKRDSVQIIHLLKEVDNYVETDTARALELAETALKQAEKVHFEYGIGQANLVLGDIYNRKGEHDIALEFLQVAYNRFASINATEGILKAMIKMALAKRLTGAYDESIRMYMNVIDLADSTGLVRYEILANGNIGEIYRLQKDGKHSVEYLSKAFLMSRKYGDRFLEMANLHNLALAHDVNGEPDLAITLLDSCFHYSDILSADDSARIYNNIGRIYVLKKQFDSGEKYLFKALKIRENLNVPYGLAHVYNEIASLYIDINDYKKAIYYGEKSYKIAKEIEMIYLLDDASRNLALAYELSGNYEKALPLIRENTEVVKQIYNNEKTQILIDADVKYQTAQKEKKIALLSAEKEMAERTKIALLTGMILLLMIIGLIIFLYRINIKKQQALRALTQSKLDLSNKELSIKKRELEHFASLIREKNKMLSELEEEMMATDDDKKYDQISRLTQSIILTEDDWENFKTIFEEVHVNFFAKLRDKYPDLSISEVRLTSLMKLNLSNKEIGNMLGISPSSVIKSKYRLKKKLQMSEEEKLDTFVVAI